jgi:hypothetical protein
MTQKHRQLLSKHLPEAIIQELRLVSQEKNRNDLSLFLSQEKNGNDLSLFFKPKRNILIVEHGCLVESIDYHSDGDEHRIQPRHWRTYVVLYDGDGDRMAFCDRVPKQFLRLFREEKY